MKQTEHFELPYPESNDYRRLLPEQMEAAMTGIDSALYALVTALSTHNTDTDAHAALFAAQAAALAAHASRHAAGGADPITPAAINAVNKAGDTMTGALKTTQLFLYNETARFLGNENRVQLESLNVAGNYNNRRVLDLYNSAAKSAVKSALLLHDVIDGAAAAYTVLHTGNKPSGSYTGNGSAAERTIDTGGFGNVVFVNSSIGSALIGGSGAVCFLGETVTGLKSNQAKFVGGVLTLQTDSTYANSSAVTYYYQVL